MNVENIILYAAIIVLITITMVVLDRAASKKIDIHIDKKQAYRVHRLYQVLGFMVIIMGMVFTISILMDGYKEDRAGFLVFVWLIFGFFSTIPLLLYYNHWVTWDEEALTVSDWMGSTQYINWDEIQHVKLNAFSGYYQIEGHGKVVKLHQHLVRVKTVLSLVEERSNLFES